MRRRHIVVGVDRLVFVSDDGMLVVSSFEKNFELLVRPRKRGRDSVTIPVGHPPPSMA